MPISLILFIGDYIRKVGAVCNTFRRPVITTKRTLLLQSEWRLLVNGGIAITSLGKERANLSAFRTFVRFVFVWICRFPLPLGVWEGLRFVTVALPGLFSYLFFQNTEQSKKYPDRFGNKCCNL